MATAIFPGSFDPPTYGHVEVATRALKVFKDLYIVCSTNPSKNNRWFKPEECVEMWKSYNLPPSINIVTFEEMQRLLIPDITIVRGLDTQVKLVQKLPLSQMRIKTLVSSIFIIYYV